MRLRDLRGFAFDLDGCIWAGAHLRPGVQAFLAALRREGRPMVFLTNNSRERPEPLADRLTRLGVPAAPEQVLTALELLGETIRRRFGPSPVLALGTDEMAAVLKAAGHTVVAPGAWEEARVVAVGNDPTFDYAKLQAAARAVARGAGFVTVNLDPRLPLEGDAFEPGGGALAEAIAVAGGARPLVVGKPFRPIFEIALERLGCRPEEAAMVGDSLGTDIRGGLEAGMVTIWLAPPEASPGALAPHLRVASFAELLARWEAEAG